MRYETITIYKYNELNEESKELALEKLCHINIDHDWYEYTYEDAKTIGLRIEGFDEHQCLGTFTEYTNTVVQLILDNHGYTTNTYQDATNFKNDLANLEDEYTQEQRDSENDYDYAVEDLEAEFHKSILDNYRIILKNEYEYQTSEEAVIETIEANDYEFYENGDLI